MEILQVGPCLEFGILNLLLFNWLNWKRYIDIEI